MPELCWYRHSQRNGCNLEALLLNHPTIGAGLAFDAREFAKTQLDHHKRWPKATRGKHGKRVKRLLEKLEKAANRWYLREVK